MDPETWDWENAEVHEPSKRARAIVSVAFPGDAFDIVSDGAQRAGKKPSAFIREAALHAAAPSRRPDATGVAFVIAQSLIERGLIADLTVLQFVALVNDVAEIVRTT